MESIAELKQETKSLKLSYTSDSTPGFWRKKTKDIFAYYDTGGQKITDEDALKRIKSLVIPPAWTDVWICPKTNGHLQATGIDAAGRKQYKYHPAWSKFRNERKHNRMKDFAVVLPAIRKQIEKDLNIEEFSKAKIVALAVSVMDKTHIRVGNSIYTKLYGSFGLTSLRNKHVKISGNKMTISFRGKKGVQQEVVLTHTKLIKLIKKVKDIPGQELFQYYDDQGNKKSLESNAINEYIETCTGQDFTAKDFRTWWGTVIAATQLAAYPASQSHTESHKNMLETLDKVAKELGNTRTVCKKYYVHPRLLEYYEDGRLEAHLEKIRPSAEFNHISPEKVEKMILDFISSECA